MPPDRLAGKEGRGRIVPLTGKSCYRVGACAFRVEQDVHIGHSPVAQQHTVREREALMPFEVERLPVDKTGVCVCHVAAT